MKNYKMASHNADNISSALKPESLKNQASEKISMIIIERCLPSLRRCWGNGDDTGYLVKGFSVEENENDVKLLLEMKRWYDNNEWFGNRHSEFHKLVSKAFAKVLVYLYFYDLQEILFIFILQVMFCTEVGYLTGEECDYSMRKGVCHSVTKILQLMTPFMLEAIHTLFIRFEDPTLLVLLLKNSPGLKKLYLHHGLSDYMLIQIRKFCPNLEIIEIHNRKKVCEEYLFKSFFKGMDKEAVIDYVDKKDSCPLSFPKLKEIKLPPYWTDIAYFIQYFYPMVQCNINYEVHDPLLAPSVLKEMLEPPACLQGKKKFKIDVVRYSPSNSVIWKECNESISYPTVRQLVVHHSADYNISEIAISNAKRILKVLGCQSVSHVIPPTAENPGMMITSLVDWSGFSLSELCLSLWSPIKVSSLYVCLNNCPNLKLFKVLIDLLLMDNEDRVQGILNPLPNLTNLSVCIVKPDVNGHNNHVISALSSASPKLEVFEVCVCKVQEILKDLVLSGKLSALEMLSACHTGRTWSFHFLVFLATRLPSLRILRLNLTEEEHIQANNYFRNTELQIINKDSFFV